MAFSPDYEIMVTGSDDERVRIFNAVSGELVCKLKGHTGELSVTRTVLEKLGSLQLRKENCHIPLRWVGNVFSHVFLFDCYSVTIFSLP